jgi:hypothetical protein
MSAASRKTPLSQIMTWRFAWQFAAADCGKLHDRMD